MSQTVTRVMTVMMVGLVAMLATKAEAHSKYVKPIGIYYCPPSVCVGAHTEEGALANNHDEIAGVRLEVPSSGIKKLCNGTSEDSSESVTLVARKRIEDVTHVTVRGRIIARQGTVVFITPDSSLGRYMLCNDGRTIPSAVLFTNFDVAGETFAETAPGSCDPSNDRSEGVTGPSCDKVGGSAFKLNCTSAFSFANPPSNGALYNCH